jgi:hypothetical protein
MVYPGAAMAGFMYISFVGPYELKAETSPPVGLGKFNGGALGGKERVRFLFPEKY